MGYLGSCSGVFFAVEKESGRVDWSYDTRLDGEPVTFHGDAIVVGDLVITGNDGIEPGWTYAFERAGGELKWKAELGTLDTDLIGVRQPGDSATLVIGGSRSGDAVAFDTETGKERWRFQTEEHTYERDHSRRPAATDSTVFFGGQDGTIYALDSESGAVRWRRPLGSKVATSLTLVDDHLFVGAGDGRLLRLNPESGDVTAERQLDKIPIDAIVDLGESIAVFVGTHKLSAFDLGLEAELWSQKPALGWSTPQPLVLERHLIVGDASGQLYAVDRASGEVVWTFGIKDIPRGLAGDESVLMVGNQRGTLFGIRPVSPEFGMPTPSAPEPEPPAPSTSKDEPKGRSE